MRILTLFQRLTHADVKTVYSRKSQSLKQISQGQNTVTGLLFVIVRAYGTWLKAILPSNAVYGRGDWGKKDQTGLESTGKQSTTTFLENKFWRHCVKDSLMPVFYKTTLKMFHNLNISIDSINIFIEQHLFILMPLLSCPHFQIGFK